MEKLFRLTTPIVDYPTFGLLHIQHNSLISIWFERENVLPQYKSHGYVVWDKCTSTLIIPCDNGGLSNYVSILPLFAKALSGKNLVKQRLMLMIYQN